MDKPEPKINNFSSATLEKSVVESLVLFFPSVNIFSSFHLHYLKSIQVLSVYLYLNIKYHEILTTITVESFRNSFSQIVANGGILIKSGLSTDTRYFLKICRIKFILRLFVLVWRIQIILDLLRPRPGTRQYCRDNVTMFSGHKVVCHCITIFIVATPSRHHDLNIFLIFSGP